MVFDARTGALVSLNREAKRIVDGLRTAGRSAAELLEVITCQRADGREVSLAEFPLAQQLSAAETVRAEEIVLSVPDGRSVKTLINATPIHSADGEVESVVVTLQDLAPLEELERQRADFLSMVSHELRAPLTSIKGSTATVLGASRAFDPGALMQFFRIIDAQADHMGGLIGDLLDQGRIDAGTLSVSVEPAEVAEPGRPGPEHVRERRRPAHPAHRPAGGPALGDGRPATHRPGARQPALECGAALARVVTDPGRGGARRRPRRGLGSRRRTGRAARAAAAPVPQAR